MTRIKQLRLQREDFEVLKIIGRGAFGEVRSSAPTSTSAPTADATRPARALPLALSFEPQLHCSTLRPHPIPFHQLLIADAGFLGSSSRSFCAAPPHSLSFSSFEFGGGEWAGHPNSSFLFDSLAFRSVLFRSHMRRTLKGFQNKKNQIFLSNFR